MENKKPKDVSSVLANNVIKTLVYETKDFVQTGEYAKNKLMRLLERKEDADIELRKFLDKQDYKVYQLYLIDKQKECEVATNFYLIETYKPAPSFLIF